MNPRRLALVLLLPLLVAGAREAAARIAGGGDRRADCYAEFDGITRAPYLGPTGVECTDGDPSCDDDKLRNGVCTFAITVCLHQTDVPGCTPHDIVSIKSKFISFPIAMLPATAPVCAPRTIVEVQPRDGGRAGKKTIRFIAKSTGDPRVDFDTVTLRCRPGIDGVTTTSTSSTTTTSSSSTTSTSSTIPQGTSTSSTTSSSTSTTSTSTTTTTSSSSTTTTIPGTTTSTSTSSTTSTTIAPCCSAERLTLSSSAGALKVGGFQPFPFPSGVKTIIDAGAPDATCKHDVIVPQGGFAVPSFCIPALQYTSQVTVKGCEMGGTLGKGLLWDGHAAAHGGVPDTDVTKKADSSDGTCDTSPGTIACANRDLNLSGKIETTRSVGGNASKVSTRLDIPAHSTTWQDAAGCPGNGVYNPGEGDTLVTEFDFILSPTTGVATGQFTDLNADGCDLPGGSAGFGAPSTQCAAGAKGPCALTGVEAPGPCCSVGQSTTVVTVGAAFSNSFPLYDLGFASTIPSTVQSCGAFVPGSCVLTTNPCLGSPSGAFVVDGASRLRSEKYLARKFVSGEKIR